MNIEKICNELHKAINASPEEGQAHIHQDELMRVYEENDVDTSDIQDFNDAKGSIESKGFSVSMEASDLDNHYKVAII